MSLNLAVLLRDAAHRAPDRCALVSGDRRLTYRELHDAARGFASGLQRRGIGRGDHVALMLPNEPEFAIAYFGVLYAGAAIVPLNILLKTGEIAYHLDDSRAVAAVVDHRYADRAGPGIHQVDRCATVIWSGGDRGPTVAELSAEAPVDELPNTSPDDTAVLLYTSGTTGRPKGAELSHFNLFYNADYSAHRLLRLENATALVALPLFHSFGQTVLQNCVIATTGTQVLMKHFEAGEAFRLMTEHRVELFAGVPTMYFGLLHHEDAARFDPSHLRQCVSGGAPMPVEVMREFETRFSATILEGYGLSETSPVASFNTHERRRTGSIGHPIQGLEFKLIDEQGTTIHDTDTPGELCIKGHAVMKGYYRRPEATTEAIRDGWFRTGDVATVDADRFYFIVDRLKDMILRGGFNVYPREIEELLYEHPAITEAAVIGVPHAELGEEIEAVVATAPGATVTPDDIIEYCKSRLAAYKYPRTVKILPELPKGPTGKILKRELRPT